MLILEKSLMELKSILGKRTTENGQQVRMNKIALEQIKYVLKSDMPNKKDGLYQIFGGGDYTNDNLSHNAIRKMKILCRFTISLEGIGVHMYIEGYRTDHLKGICEDGDVNCIRLVKDDGHVIKKKIGKVVTEYLRGEGMYCEQAITFIAETVAQRWKAYATEHSPQGCLELVLDDDFDAIYDSDKQIGDFHSCMNGHDCVSFYREVGAEAASLRDEDGNIHARCVVFHNVHDNNGGLHDYAERQYSTNQDLTLQQLLINKLYAGGHIDLNKRVGASCWDSNDVTDGNGNTFGVPMFISHYFAEDDYVPFMDGFAWYDPCEGKVWNDSNYGEQELHSTSGVYVPICHCAHCGCTIQNDDDRCWSDYLQQELCSGCAQWCDEISDYCLARDAVRVYWDGGDWTWMPSDWNDHSSSNNFTYIDGEDEYYFDSETCYDYINDEDILFSESVEYKGWNGSSWYYERTHENEIDNSIIYFEDGYYLIDDCVEVDGVLYPCDRVPEEEDEEVVVGVA